MSHIYGSSKELEIEKIMGRRHLCKEFDGRTMMKKSVEMPKEKLKMIIIIKEIIR